MVHVAWWLHALNEYVYELVNERHIVKQIRVLYIYSLYTICPFIHPKVVQLNLVQ